MDGRGDIITITMDQHHSYVLYCQPLNNRAIASDLTLKLSFLALVKEIISMKSESTEINLCSG